MESNFSWTYPQIFIVELVEFPYFRVDITNYILFINIPIFQIPYDLVYFWYEHRYDYIKFICLEYTH